ncbi:hypothetical protein [Eisenibacter elegans]|jgi:CII-binding regulator of phage lambda lysogenization HflD|uniref:hypothetical protein n=1 Tax=Eisenibacter elegans TaxID=997 RepID=UPI00040BF14B|nr:hypothetical protein [Eisenibacter elegans]
MHTLKNLAVVGICLLATACVSPKEFAALKQSLAETQAKVYAKDEQAFVYIDERLKAVEQQLQSYQAETKESIKNLEHFYKGVESSRGSMTSILYRLDVVEQQVRQVGGNIPVEKKENIGKDKKNAY